MHNRFSIYCTSDDNYVFPSIVTIESVRRFHPECDYFVLGNRNLISQEKLRVLKKFNIGFLHSDKNEQFLNDFWPNTSYLKLFGPEILLEEGYEYSLGLDADTLCVRPLQMESIFEKTEGYSGIENQTPRSRNFLELEFIRKQFALTDEDLNSHNTNTGIVFWNNKAVAEKKLAQRVVQAYRICASVKRSIHPGDQALLALISVMEPRIAFNVIDYKYNYRVGNTEDLKLSVDGVRIFHYTEFKPWTHFDTQVLEDSLSRNKVIELCNYWHEFVTKYKLFTNDRMLAEWISLCKKTRSELLQGTHVERGQLATITSSFPGQKEVATNDSGKTYTLTNFYEDSFFTKRINRQRPQRFKSSSNLPTNTLKASKPAEETMVSPRSRSENADVEHKFSNLLDLKQFFTGIDDYVILRLPDSFPNYRDYSDIDILCKKKEDFLTHILGVGGKYEQQGWQIRINRDGPNLHVDFYPPNAERLNFRFDLVDSLSYGKFSLDGAYSSVVLQNRRRVKCDGVEVWVPAVEHDLAIRFFEYIEWRDARPEKVKHWEYIRNCNNTDFAEVVNKYTDMDVRLQYVDGEVNLDVSKKDRKSSVADGKKAAKYRIDYFLIWGHGLPYTEQILGILRESKDIEIISIVKKNVGDIAKFVQDIYACDTVPFHHLVDKTKYLLNTKPEIIFILVKNKNPQEKLFGEGAFRHIQCSQIKDIKEQIRNKFNPRVNGKRTEYHVIHASDYQSQVEHVLCVLDLPPIEHYTRKPHPDLDLPYHLADFDNYQIKDIDIDLLYANVLGVGLVPIIETPHYKYLTGDKAIYHRYVAKYIGVQLTDDHCPEAFDTMIAKFEYGRVNDDGRKSYIVAIQIADNKYQILDGVHRAAILKYRAARTVTIVEPQGAAQQPQMNPPSGSQELTENDKMPQARCIAENAAADVRTTVFIITIEDPVFERCMEAVRGQTYKNFKIDIVRNFKPFSAAMQEVIDRCDTDYLIPLDEDMILEPNAVRTMEQTIDAAPDDVGMICFHLYDQDRRQKIHGVKIFRTKHLKDIKVRNVRASEMDLLEQMGEKGIKWVVHSDVMGQHGTMYTAETIYHRYKSMYEKDINVWNTLTWDLRKKADRYHQTADPLQLFAVLGAAHGIINAPNAADVEAKNFTEYDLKALETFKRLLLAEPVYATSFDPNKQAQEFKNQPLRFEDVKWKSISQRDSIKTTAIGHLSKRTSESLSILHTVEFYYPHIGGAEKVIQELSERLARRGHRVTVAAGTDPQRTFRQFNGVEIKEFDVNGTIACGISGPDVARYQQFLLDHPADVMTNYAAQQWATDLAFKVLPQLKNKRVNVIAPCGYSALSDSRTICRSRFKDYYNLIIPAYLPQYDAAVYHSSQYQDFQYASEHGFANSVIIPNGSDELEFSKKPNVDFRRKYNITTKYIGLCVANFYEKAKRHDRVVEAVRQMNRPDFTLVFIGRDGEYLPRIKEQAAGLNIRFLINIPREDTVAAFHCADVFLFGSETEASPLVIIEAKASRTPFVSTDCGNVREWKGGIVCAPGEMASNVNKILDDKALHDKLTEEGWREWKEKLTWESIVDRYEELYLQLYRSKTGKSAPAVIALPQTNGVEDRRRDTSLQSDRRIVALIFSKDRAMQLKATIDSFLLHCKDSDKADIAVLYKTSNDLHGHQYRQLKNKFPDIIFTEETDFRQQVLSALGKYEYVLFLVDDNIFVKPFTLQEITDVLDREKSALGFSLRLGTNTTYCYPVSSQQKLPEFEQSGDRILKYRWPGQEFDFGYPLEVSSSLYRCRDVLPFLDRLEFANPNALESNMDLRNNFPDTLPLLLTFKQSVTFCNPVNVVQCLAKNKHGLVNSYTADDLAERFSHGMEIEVQKYTGFTPHAAHQEVKPYFRETQADSAYKELALLEAGEAGCNRPDSKRQPKFSVIMANYNNAAYIGQAIESVLNQTYPDWELIIIDDCSTDGSLEIIDNFREDCRIRLIKHEHNRGYIAALKTGIAEVRSEYFGILDSDDCLRHDAIKIMYDYHVLMPNCGLIYSQFVACDENLVPKQMGYCDKIPAGKTDMEANKVSHFKTFKLSAYLKTSGYDEEVLYAEDKDIIMKIEEVTRLRFVDECLYMYRMLPDSQCHGQKEAVGKKSWEKAKENARRRRTAKRNEMLGPNANIPAADLIAADANSISKIEVPEFSIVMANYNNGKYIGDAIKSVLNQTFKKWELIIVDDGSTDNSSELIAPFLKDRRIKLLRHNCNKGYTVALKTAIGQVRSNCFAILDSDDCLSFDAVEVMHREHVANPDCGLIYSQLHYCDENLLPFRAGDNYAIPPDKTSLDCNAVTQLKTFKLADYLKTEGYDEDILYAEDKDIIYKMEEVTKLKFVDKTLYLARELPTSQCHCDRKADVGMIAAAKAKINAIQRRCRALSNSGKGSFEDLLLQAISESQKNYGDIKKYFITLKRMLAVLKKTSEKGGRLRYLDLPEQILHGDIDAAVYWLAANMKFKKVMEVVELIEDRMDAGKKPLVSVYTVTYNAARYLRKAIDSVMAQTYRKFELLIIDDGSTDNTKEIVASAIVDYNGDPRIRYIYKPHKNFASGVNRAIIEARGEYLLAVDSDDFIEPDYIEKMVACAEKHPDVEYFYPRRLVLVNETGESANVVWEYLDFSDNRVLPAFLFANAFSPIPNPGSLKRKSLFQKDMYQELDTVEDFVFLCKNAWRIRFKKVDDCSNYYYRRLPSSNSRKFEARNRLTACTLNNMISAYAPEVLCPNLVNIGDKILRQQQYYRYLVETFSRHSQGSMVQYPQYFKKYADYYNNIIRQTREIISEQKRNLADTADKSLNSRRFQTIIKL
jgi:glycosyltransferase involved in cell wall biosynthesis/lipopolysaccharide biosynthesis glycosyltransferase